MSRLRLHEGQAMMKLAKTYHTLHDTILEGVQNAVDSNATRIWIVVDRDKRWVLIRDNGNGADTERFERSLQSVGQSIKDADDYGRFGLGLISPLGKCREFTFTSRKRDSDEPYRRWTFISEKIENQKHDLEIPDEVLKGYKYMPMATHTLQGKHVPWTTEVHIKDYASDRIISDISASELGRDIRSQFRVKMREIDTRVEIIIHEGGRTSQEAVRAIEYEGEPLEEMVYTDPDHGRVEIRLLLAPIARDGKRHGSVDVGETGNKFRIPFTRFAHHWGHGRHLLNETRTALRSGTFSGEILSSGIILREDRKNYVDDEALRYLMECIEDWYIRIGIEVVAEVRGQQKERRFQDIGRKALQELEELIKKEEFSYLGLGVERFRHGRKSDLSRNGAGRKKESQRSAKPEKKPHGKEPSEKKRTKPPKPADAGWGAAGPEGSRKRRVRNEGLGLEFRYDETMGARHLWELDEENGILYFNTTHPTWVRFEDNDRMLELLQQTAAVQALVLVVQPDEWQPRMRDAMLSTLPPFLHLQSRS